MKIPPTQVKNVIRNYSVAFLTKFPELKPIVDIIIDTYEAHILSADYNPVSLNVDLTSKIKKLH